MIKIQTEREIIKLTRLSNGKFCIYADGELSETYEAELDTWHVLLPLKLWRTFNKIVQKRIKLMDIPEPVKEVPVKTELAEKIQGEFNDWADEQIETCNSLSEVSILVEAKKKIAEILALLDEWVRLSTDQTLPEPKLYGADTQKDMLTPNAEGEVWMKVKK